MCPVSTPKESFLQQICLCGDAFRIVESHPLAASSWRVPSLACRQDCTLCWTEIQRFFHKESCSSKFNVLSSDTKLNTLKKNILIVPDNAHGSDERWHAVTERISIASTSTRSLMRCEVTTQSVQQIFQLPDKQRYAGFMTTQCGYGIDFACVKITRFH